jgi:anti-sigma B factor antagonist
MITTMLQGGAMTIQERAIGSVVVLDMSGRLVLGDGDQLLKERLSSHLRQGNRQVVLNVSNLSYVDSSGLGVIVGSVLAARSQGGALRLVNPSSRLHQLLAMAKLLTVVDVCASEEEAVGSFGYSDPSARVTTI